ncbi:MAG: hypothetical protein P8X96_08730 [Desulfobacteraceae bacterium]
MNVQQPMTILVLDDEPIVSKRLQPALEKPKIGIVVVGRIIDIGVDHVEMISKPKADIDILF